MTTIWTLLPAYNEEESLPPLLERFRPLVERFREHDVELRIVVVDDGSADRTAEIARTFAEDLTTDVVCHETNKGLGAAVRTGIQYILEHSRKTDLLASMDADNTHDPMLLVEMWRTIQSRQADVVIASRYAPGGEEIGLSGIRKFLSRGASFFLTLAMPVPGARDYTCGYRLYRVSALAQAAKLWRGELVSETGFTCMAELLLKLGRSGATVTEAPLVLRYDLKAGPSKMNVARTISRYFVLVTRLRFGGVPGS